MIREACGTLFGLRLHQVADEPVCGTCALAERARHIEAENRGLSTAEVSDTEHLLQLTIAALADMLDNVGTRRRSA